MRLTGESMFVSARAGQKNGKEWHMLKFLDEDAEEFFTAFVDETLSRQFQKLPKHTPVNLTLNLVPGQKYFSLESVEAIHGDNFAIIFIGGCICSQCFNCNIIQKLFCQGRDNYLQGLCQKFFRGAIGGIA